MYHSPPSDPELGRVASWRRLAVRSAKVVGVLLGSMVGLLAACVALYLLFSGNLAEYLAAKYWRACCSLPLTIGLTVLGIVIWRNRRSAG